MRENPILKLEVNLSEGLHEEAVERFLLLFRPSFDGIVCSESCSTEREESEVLSMGGSNELGCFLFPGEVVFDFGLRTKGSCYIYER